MNIIHLPPVLTLQARIALAILLMTTLLPQSQQVCAQSISDGLVAFYSFTNGSTADASGNGNHLTNYGARLSLDRLGMPGRSFYFSGTDYMVHNRGFAVTRQISICVWLKPEVWSANYSLPVCIGDDSRNIRVCYYPNKGKVGFDGWFGSAIGISESKETVPVGKWTFVVGVRNGTDWQLYINGELDTRISGPANVFSDLNLALSKNAGRYQQDYFKGEIDEVMIYDRALSPAEIQNLFSPSQITQRSSSDNKEYIRRRSDEILLRVKVVVEQVNREKRGTAALLRALLALRDRLHKDPSYSDEAQLALQQSEQSWQTLQSILSSIDRLSLQIEQLRKENLNVVSLEKALDASKSQLESETPNYDAIAATLSDAQSNADNSWSAHQSILQTRASLKDIAAMGADVGKAQNKLDEAVEALDKGSPSIAIERIREAYSLAENASFGKVAITDIRALANKYDRHNLVVSGSVRSIETVYGRGYKFTVDDGTGLINVIYEGSLKGINDGDEAIVEGAFTKSQDRITATKVEKASFLTLPKLLGGALLIVLVIGAFFLAKKFRKPSVGHGS